MQGLNWSIIEMSSPPSSHFHAQCYGFCLQVLVCWCRSALGSWQALTLSLCLLSLWHLLILREIQAHTSFFLLFTSSHFIVSIFGRRASLSPDVFLHPFNHEGHAPFTLHSMFSLSHTACLGSCFSCIFFTSEIIGNQFTDNKRRKASLQSAYFYP